MATNDRSSSELCPVARTATLNLMDKDCLAPAVLNCCASVPGAIAPAAYFVEKHAIVKPAQLCSNLLHKFFLRPDLTEPPHVLQISRRESLHFGERTFQVGCKAVDDLCAPAFTFLAFENVAAN